MPLTILTLLSSHCHFPCSKPPLLPHTHSLSQTKNCNTTKRSSCQATQDQFTSQAMRPITAPAATPAAAVSPWHSPVPYLFGGLAAMMGLIALALLVLACSYLKLNNYLGTADSSSSGSGATDGDGSKSPATAAAASPAVFADLVAVVMAGEKMPTFLAAPIVRRPDAGEGSQQLDQV